MSLISIKHYIMLETFFFFYLQGYKQAKCCVGHMIKTHYTELSTTTPVVVVECFDPLQSYQ